MDPVELRAMAKRLEMVAMLLEAGDSEQRRLAEDIRGEVTRLRRWASGRGDGGGKLTR